MPLDERQKEFLGLAAQYVFPSPQGLIPLGATAATPPARPMSTRIAIATAVIAILTQTFSFVWYLAYKDRDFADARKEIQDNHSDVQVIKKDLEGRASIAELAAAKRIVASQGKQITWMHLALGNPNNRWTFSMESFTFDYFCQQNGLKAPDLSRIHENLMTDFPKTEFPESIDP